MSISVQSCTPRPRMHTHLQVHTQLTHTYMHPPNHPPRYRNPKQRRYNARDSQVYTITASLQNQKRKSGVACLLFLLMPCQILVYVLGTMMWDHCHTAPCMPHYMFFWMGWKNTRRQIFRKRVKRSVRVVFLGAFNISISFIFSATQGSGCTSRSTMGSSRTACCPRPISTFPCEFVTPREVDRGVGKLWCGPVRP